MFTDEEISMLAKLDEDMDAGIQPYVVVATGGRMMVSADVMSELGLKQGQAVSSDTARHITMKSLAAVQTTIAIEKAQKFSMKEQKQPEPSPIVLVVSALCIFAIGAAMYIAL